MNPIGRIVLTAALILPARLVFGQAAGPALTGVYESISAADTLPGGLKNSGSPSEVTLQPAAAEKMKSVNLKEDADRLCLPVGPFRMMAGEHVRIEFAPSAPGLLYLFYEDISHGHMRLIHFDRPHPARLEPTWLGDSTGKWEGDTFVIDTVGFNDRTWLNKNGAPHSDALHLTERIRLVLNGTALEYKVTAEDPKALMRPYTYTRYYQKSPTEIREDFCEVPE
jgi:hypothetical protein